MWILIGVLWKDIQKFYHRNYSYFDMSFLAVYSLEQFLLILFLTWYPESTSFWVASFALVVITTASLQKLTSDSRNRKINELYSKHLQLNYDLSDQFESCSQENSYLRNENIRLAKHIESLRKYIEKILNQGN